MVVISEQVLWVHTRTGLSEWFHVKSPEVDFKWFQFASDVFSIPMVLLFICIIRSLATNLALSPLGCVQYFVIHNIIEGKIKNKEMHKKSKKIFF